MGRRSTFGPISPSRPSRIESPKQLADQAEPVQRDRSVSEDLPTPVRRGHLRATPYAEDQPGDVSGRLENQAIPPGRSGARQPRHHPRGEPPDKGKGEGHPHLRRDPRGPRGFAAFGRGRERGRRSAERRPVRIHPRAAAARSRRAARARSTPEPRLDPCGNWEQTVASSGSSSAQCGHTFTLATSASGRRRCNPVASALDADPRPTDPEVDALACTNVPSLARATEQLVGVDCNDARELTCERYPLFLPDKSPYRDPCASYRRFALVWSAYHRVVMSKIRPSRRAIVLHRIGDPRNDPALVAHGAINLSQGFPDFPAPQEIKEAARQAIAATSTSTRSRGAPSRSAKRSPRRTARATACRGSSPSAT